MTEEEQVALVVEKSVIKYSVKLHLFEGRYFGVTEQDLLNLYCVVSLDGKVCKSKVSWMTCVPYWREVFAFPEVDSTESSELNVAVWSLDDSEKPLGSFSVSQKRFKTYAEQDQIERWFVLREDLEEAGQLYCRFEIKDIEKMQKIEAEANTAGTDSDSRSDRRKSKRSPRNVFKAHKFTKALFSHPTFCAICQSYIWGLSKAGYQCSECGLDVHRKCIAEAKKVSCNISYVQSRKISEIQTTEEVKKIGDTFTVHLSNGSKKSMIMQEGQTLELVLKKLCLQRGIDYDSHIVEDTSGHVLDGETLLMDIPGSEITFMHKDASKDALKALFQSVSKPVTHRPERPEILVLDTESEGHIPLGGSADITLLALDTKKKKPKVKDPTRAQSGRTPRSSIQDDYDMGELIGSGATSSVYLGTNLFTSAAVAIKIIERTGPETDADIKKEIDIMKRLDHEMLIKLIDYEEDVDSFFVILEYVDGCELFDLIVENGYVEESKAVPIVEKILKGVKYLHENSIVHRDLKPENIMYIRETEAVKIIDFGESSTSKKMKSFVGTPDYMSPEIVKGAKYDQSVDMWAIGVITYVTLSGKPTFDGQNDFEVFANIMACNYSFPRSEWDYITELARTFIESLLVAEPNQRLSAEKALEHEWIKSGGVFDYYEEEEY